MDVVTTKRDEREWGLSIRKDRLMLLERSGRYHKFSESINNNFKGLQLYINLSWAVCICQPYFEDAILSED